MSAIHTTSLPTRLPSWAHPIATESVATDHHVRLRDLPDKIFPVLAPHASGVVVIRGRLCVTLP